MDFNEVKEKSDRYLFQNYGRIPLSFTHGSGCYLYGSDGREYLDLVAGIAVNSLGYAHPDVTRAIQEQAARMTHVSNLYYVEQQAELAERIASITPGELDRTLFCNSGAEANEGALKTAVRYTGRSKVLAALDGFHGRTSAAMGATGQESIQKSFEPLIAHSYGYFRFGDLEGVKEMMTKDVAALIVEPIQGESGVHTASAEFFKGVRDLCDDNGTVMIADEVQTGIGRTGEWYGIQNYGVVPDIITMAKALETDYSFRYSQRFFNDRVQIIIGVQMDTAETASMVQRYCRDNGVLINVAHGGTIRLIPPLIINDEQKDVFTKLLAEALEQ